MIKSILEEIIIALLLCLVIIVVLGIMLYEYVPIAKTLPTPVEYKTSEKIKEQLQEADVLDESQVIMTYEVNASDLNNYKRIQNYQPGKSNPFAAEVKTSGTTGGNQSSTSGGSTSSSSGSNSGTNTNTSNNNTNSESQTGGQFFQNTGTK